MTHILGGGFRKNYLFIATLVINYPSNGTKTIISSLKIDWEFGLI